MISSAVLQAYTGSTDTATLAIYESAVIAWLQNWIPRYLGTSTQLTEILDGPRRSRDLVSRTGDGRRYYELWLKEVITTASLVSIKYRDTLDGTWTNLDTTLTGNYEIDGFKLIRLPEPFPSGYRNLQIIYTHGYAEDAGPDDVEAVALQIIKAMMDQKTVGEYSEEETIAGSRVRYANVVKLKGVNTTMLASLKRTQYNG